MGDLLLDLTLAALLWMAIVPLLTYRTTDPGLEQHERVRLALARSGMTLLWTATLGVIAGSALLAGGREAMVVALMGLMFALFGVAAVVRARAAAGTETLVAQPSQVRR